MQGLRKDGREIDVSLSLSSVQIKGSWHAVGIVHDITERKHAEILERAVYEIARAADEAKSLDELYRSVHLIIKDLMPAANFLIAVYDEKRADHLSLFCRRIRLAAADKKAGQRVDRLRAAHRQALLFDAELEKWAAAAKRKKSAFPLHAGWVSRSRSATRPSA